MLYFCTRLMKRGPEGSRFALINKNMIDKVALNDLIVDYLKDKECELITLKVSENNEILVEVDSVKGVDLDFCSDLNHFIQDNLDREVEDYELEVGSVSLTAPFKTRMQYEKNLGNEVEVLTKNGIKLYGQLVSVDEDSFAVDVEVLVQEEGKKRKTKAIKTLTFKYDDVKSVKYNLVV